MKIKAQKTKINRGTEWQHGVDKNKVAAIIEAIDQEKELPLPLLVDRPMGYLVIDGHHRIAAYEETGKFYDAWVIKEADFEAMLAEDFMGNQPSRLVDIWDYIILPNGRTYSES